MLLDKLDDSNAIILIHVDSRSATLYGFLQSMISTRDAAAARPPNTGNIHLSRVRFSGVWGHISLVHMQLSGFFELRDLADWDYVINLSNYEWPLLDNLGIRNQLNKESGEKEIGA